MKLTSAKSKPGVMLLCNPEDCTATGAPDEVLILRMPVPKRKKPSAPDHTYVGKRYALQQDGLVKRLDSNKGMFFTAQRYGVASVDDVHQVFERSRLGLDGGPGCAVSGAIADGADASSLRRTKAYVPTVRDAAGKIIRRAVSKGLKDADRHWLVLDCEEMPSEGIDPRRDPEGALALIRSRLPPAISRARTSWQWSSSCCLARADKRPLADECPETVRVHLRVWVDTSIDELTRRRILQGINAFSQGICPDAVVDPATATYNQSIYACVHLDGLDDPFPGDLRSGVLDGDAEVVLADLEAQLPPPEVKEPNAPKAQRASRAMTEEEKELRTAARKARTGHDTLLRAARRPAAAPKAEAPEPFVRSYPAPKRSAGYEKGKQARIDARMHIFRNRALGDVIRLTDGRREHDPEWSDGVPAGLRTRTLRAVAALLSWTVPYAELRSELERFAIRLTSPDFYRTVFVPGNKASDILDQSYYASAAEAAGQNGGALRDDRCKTSLMNLMSPTVEEQVNYRLRALRSEAVRAAEIRDTKGIPTLEERLARPSARKDQPWVALGISRASYYSKKRAERLASPVEVPTEAAAEPAPVGLSAEGVLLLADLFDYDRRFPSGEKDIAGNTESAERMFRGLGMGRYIEAVARGWWPSEIMETQARACTGPGRAQAVQIAISMQLIDPRRFDSDITMADMLSYTLSHHFFGEMIRTRPGPVIASPESIVADYRSIADAEQAYTDVDCAAILRRIAGAHVQKRDTSKMPRRPVGAMRAA